MDNPQTNDDGLKSDAGEIRNIRTRVCEVPELPLASEGISPLDGRGRYDYKSKYPPEAQRRQRNEAIYLFALFALSFLTLLSASQGWLSSFLRPPNKETLNCYTEFAASGVLGGTVFGMKYFYRVVAHGYWSEDRVYWRVLSPFVAMAVAFVVGAMIRASYIEIDHPFLGSSNVLVGFLAGYFADEAVGKMYDIASVIFGTSKQGSEGHSGPAK